MSRFNTVVPFVEGDRSYVRVGAGCTLQMLLDRLHSASNQTLPTLGAIKKQTISGAISTGTHGSGHQSLSHFVTAVRVAAYDAASGEPTIIEHRGGDELRAARCGLGCMGVIVSVEIRTVPKYNVTEVVRVRSTLDEILRVYADRPLTQFIWTPHHWKWVSFERVSTERSTTTLATRLKALAFRAHGRLVVDILLHLGIKTSQLMGGWAVRGLLRAAPYLVIRNVVRVDDAEHVLTTGHYYFRHEEMELFVAESKLPEVTEFLRCAIAIFAGGRDPVPVAIAAKLDAVGMFDELTRHRGTYLHHYPLFFRRVLGEETLISMGASLKEPSYSISIFTFSQAAHRQPYYAFCSFLAHSLNRIAAARIHWGKHFPLQYADIAPLYPELEMFRALCRRSDPGGVLRNRYTERVLALPPGAATG